MSLENRPLATTITDFAVDFGSAGLALELLTDHNDWQSLTDLARLTELSRPTIAQSLQQLQSVGLVETKTSKRSTALGGRKPQLFRRAANIYNVLVLRTRYAHCEGRIVDAIGNVVAEHIEPIADLADVLTPLLAVAERLLPLAHAPIRTTSVAIMGIVNNNSVLFSGRYPSLNDGAWEDDVAELLTTHGQSTELLVLNDAKVAATWMDYQLRTNGHTPHSLIALHCSQEIGCGIVLDGKLLHGAHGGAGEVALDNSGQWTRVGELLREAEERYGMSTRKIFALAGRNRDQYKEFIHTLTRQIGQSLAPLVIAIDPDTVAIGGALVDAGQDVADIIRDEIARISHTPPSVHLSPQGTRCVMEGASLYGRVAADNQLLSSIE